MIGSPPVLAEAPFPADETAARPLAAIIDGTLRVADPDGGEAVAEALKLLEQVGKLMVTRMVDADGIARAALIGPLDDLYDLARAGDATTVTWGEGWP